MSSSAFGPDELTRLRTLCAAARPEDIWAGSGKLELMANKLDAARAGKGST